MLFPGLSSILLALAATAAAVPAPHTPRQTAVGPQCAGLGPGAFDIAYNFTLAAWATDGPNANETGVPLVLGQAGAVDGASFQVLSTWASYPYNDFPLLTLQHGGLTAASPYGAVTEAYNTTAGQPIGFITPEQGPPVQIFCGVANTDPAHGAYPQLAVNGDTDSFSLCPAGTYPGAQTNVIYKPSPDGYGYNYTACVPVKLHILGLY